MTYSCRGDLAKVEVVTRVREEEVRKWMLTKIVKVKTVV